MHSCEAGTAISPVKSADRITDALGRMSIGEERDFVESGDAGDQRAHLGLGPLRMTAPPSLTTNVICVDDAIMFDAGVTSAAFCFFHLEGCCAACAFVCMWGRGVRRFAFEAAVKRLTTPSTGVPCVSTC